VRANYRSYTGSGVSDVVAWVSRLIAKFAGQNSRSHHERLRDSEGRAGRSPAALLLQIPPLAAVKSVLPRFDLLVALWRDGKPMLLSRVPVQIAILDCIAYLQKPRAIWRSWLCFSCFSHIKT